MIGRLLLSAALMGCGGCAGVRRAPVPEAENPAARERFRAIQAAERPVAPAEFEVVSLVRPARTENGIRREEGTDHVRILRQP